MSKYTAEFTSINNIDYKIEITSKTGTANKTVILGESPFVVTASDNDSIYEPVKTTGATITILTRDLPTDVYSGSSLGTSVKVTSGSDVIWTGYLTPCAYSQGFDNPLEELELECVDGLSVLQEIPYSTPAQDIETFMTVVFNCLTKSKCFKYLYVNDTVQFSSNETINIMEKLRVSSQNFYEEKDYDAQPDDEVAWPCFDVLTEVMRYMGYTMTCHGQDVYVIDYDSVAKNRTRYFRYDISGSNIGSSTVVNLSHSHKIVGSSYAETGNQIELSEIFNKLVITDDFYKIDSVMKGIDDPKNLTNITHTYDTTLMQWVTSNSRFKESGVYTVYGETFFCTITKNNSGDLFFVVGKFFKNSMLTTYHYSHNNNTLLNESGFNPMQYTKLWDGKGAIYVGYYIAPIDSGKYNTWHNNTNGGREWAGQSQTTQLKRFAELTAIANIPNIKLSYYILCLNQDTNHIEHDKVRQYPFFKITKSIPTIFGGVDGYLMIVGEFCRHHEFNTPFPQGGKARRQHHRERKQSVYKNEGYFWAQLKWGDMYWKAEGSYNQQGSWVNTPAQFKIFYGDPAKDMNIDTYLDKWLPFYSNSHLWGVENNGYYIPVPSGQNLQGSIELTVYSNKDSKGKWARAGHSDRSNSYNGYKPNVVVFKSLDITVNYADGTLLDDSFDEDTCYCNEVTEFDNINEADDMDFKICTFDNKTPSYSTVDYLDSTGKSQYLDQTYNIATGMSLRQEEHYITKFISQYQEPRVQYNCNLKADIGFTPYSLIEYNQLSGKKFIIDSYTTDYRFNKTELLIVEKNKTYK